MSGNNKIEMCSSAMIVAVQYYFDTVLFQTGKSPKVNYITYKNDSYSFVVSVTEVKPDQSIAEASV